MIRKLLVAMAGAALLAVLAPTPAHAATSVTAVFSAEANVGDPIFTPVAVNNPNCGAPVGVCPTADTTFAFSTAQSILGGTTCAVAAANDGADGNNVGAMVNGIGIGGTSCSLAANGQVFDATGPIFNEVGPQPTGLGSWCGTSGGEGDVTDVSVNGVQYADNADVDVQWAISAGSVLPLTFTADGTPAGVGAVQASGLEDGGGNATRCGAEGNFGNPNGAENFFVTGFATVTTTA